MNYDTECINKVSTLHQRIYPKGGHYHFNFKCHRNAKYYADKEDLGIASVICYEVGGSVIAHFINIDKKGNYIDNTVGDVGLYTEYYLVKTFTREDFGNPDNELSYLKKYIASIYNEALPRYKKKKSEDYF